MKVFIAWNIVPEDPRYWKYFEPHGIMISFSSSKYRNIRKKLESIFTMGIHEWLEYKGFIIMDSQIAPISVSAEYAHALHPRNKFLHIYYLQRYARPNKIVHKDYPLVRSDVPEDLKWKLLRKTVKNAELLRKFLEKKGVNDKEVIYVIQGWDKKSLEWCCKQYVNMGIRNYAIGSMKHLSFRNKDEIIHRIEFVREIIGKRAKLHVLGVANTKLLPILKKYVDTLDTSSPIRAAMFNEIYYIDDKSNRLRRTKITNISEDDVKHYLPAKLYAMFVNLCENIENLKKSIIKRKLAIINAYTLTRYVSLL